MEEDLETNLDVVGLDGHYAANTYSPLPVAAATADGSWITDVEGNRYLDMLSAYSAMNFGHRNPRLIEAAKRQMDRVTLTSRAIYNDQMGALCRDLSALCGKDATLLMNSGAEGVETAIKLARKWAYEVKGVEAGAANIVVADENFHGRTISIISFSSDAPSKDGFGPHTPGFRSVPFGDAQAIDDGIDANTAAVLIEPIQGGAGVIIPPDGYLRAVRDICTRRNVLFVADEIQSGLGRTGTTFACDHEDVVPDVFILGKALGGGIIPVSAVVTDRAVMDVFRPGEHGSTFGGNPLAAAIGREVVEILNTGEIQKRATELGMVLAEGLSGLDLEHTRISQVRARGLWAAIDLVDGGPTGRAFSKHLLTHGIIAKDTHGQTIRFAPPLTTSEEDIRWAVKEIGAALDSLAEVA